MPYAYSDETKQLFLDALAKTGIVAPALRAAGIKTRGTVNKWREEDEAFSRAYDEALEDAADTLEAAAWRRAVEGVVTIKYEGKGDDRQPVEEVKYSDSLMALLLKGTKPDKFADRSKTELSNPDGSFKPANETEAAVRIAAILDAARQRKVADEDELFQ